VLHQCAQSIFSVPQRFLVIAHLRHSAQMMCKQSNEAVSQCRHIVSVYNASIVLPGPYANAQVDVTVTRRFATAVYAVESASEECITCSPDLETRFRDRLCNDIDLGNCSRARAECVKGAGTARDMDFLLFIPPEVCRLISHTNL